MRNAKGGETTPSFGHPSNVRRGCLLRNEHDEKGLLRYLPKSLLIGGKGGCIPPNRREGRCSTQCKGHAQMNIFFFFPMKMKFFLLFCIEF
jgi:hypothetical protein